MTIQTIPGPSAPLDTIFLQEFLEETFSVSNSTIQKNETDNSKRIELEHNFHDKLYCFKKIIVQVASNGSLNETLENLKFTYSVRGDSD